MTLELLDGSLISPTSLFDALDTVEEYCGTDLRQYMENFLAGMSLSKRMSIFRRFLKASRR